MTVVLESPGVPLELDVAASSVSPDEDAPATVNPVSVSCPWVEPVSPPLTIALVEQPVSTRPNIQVAQAA